MIRTDFTFYKNTPFTDFQNTVYFENNEKRDLFFERYDKIDTSILSQHGYNFIRDKSSIDIDEDFYKMRLYNYGCFKERNANGTQKVYFHILEVEYINDNNTRIHFLIDGIMTFCQGNTLRGLKNLEIERQHLNKNLYSNLLPVLKTNDDILGCTTKKYIKTEYKKFDDLMVLFQCTADLEKDWGTEKVPKMPSSRGNRVDKIISPVNLYLATQLSNYPWISQNISKVLMIPDILIKSTEFETIEVKSVSLKKPKNGSISDINLTYFDDLEKNKNELYAIFGLDLEEDSHLFRNNYCNIEIYNYEGQELIVDVSQLNQEKLELATKLIVGYENQITSYIVDYKSNDNVSSNTVDRGSFLNDSISFNKFNEIPVLIDNYKLSLAKNANQRELAESRLFTNRVANVIDSKSDPFSRVMDTVNLISNVSLKNPSGILGKMTDDYEFYRNQKAQFADMKLNQNSITTMDNTNSFNIKNGFYGLTVKYACPNKREFDKIRYYYKKFGFECDKYLNTLAPLDSMSVVNYAKFKGNYFIPNVDPYILEIIKARFEIGVFFWHDSEEYDNPFLQNIENNVKVK